MQRQKVWAECFSESSGSWHYSNSFVAGILPLDATATSDLGICDSAAINNDKGCFSRVTPLVTLDCDKLIFIDAFKITKFEVQVIWLEPMPLVESGKPLFVLYKVNLCPVGASVASHLTNFPLIFSIFMSFGPFNHHFQVNVSHAGTKRRPTLSYHGYINYSYCEIEALQDWVIVLRAEKRTQNCDSS